MIRLSRTRLTLQGLFVAALLSLSGAQAASAAVDAADAQVYWRWVGLLDSPGKSCPAAPDPTVWFQLRTVDLAGRRFCVYDALLGQASGPGVPDGMWTIYPVPDAMIVQPMSTLSEEQWPYLEERFRYEAGAPELLPLEGGLLPVQVSLIDTTPDGPTPAFENSPHGESLGFLLRRFLCQDASQLWSCLFSPSPHLALGFTEFDQEAPGAWNSQNGGYVGLLSDLAFAIDSALGSWDPMESSHLVLNLSVAWDDALSPPPPGQSGLSAPEWMVRSAIEEAVCAGALVLAAAGNRFDDIQAEGPLLPAAWEALEAPDFCQAGASYEPLVYAVGAVGGGSREGIDGEVVFDDSPLPVSRKESWPPLVAVGEAAVTESGVPGTPTATLSGTSVSTLVVSMAAAAVWYYSPDAEPAEVMEVLYESGRSLLRAPDFSLCPPGGSCARPEVRRVRVCEAVRWACILGAPCPPPLLDPGLCPELPVEPLPNPVLSPQYPATGSVPLPSPPPVCQAGGVTYSYDAGNPPNNAAEYVCPSRALDGLGATPWVAPQPHSDPCPDCSVRLAPSQGSSDTLYVEIPADFAYDVCAATLERCGNHQVLRYVLPAGSQAEIEVERVPNCHAATLHVALSVEGSSCSQLTESALSGVVVVP